MPVRHGRLAALELGHDRVRDRRAAAVGRRRARGGVIDQGLGPLLRPDPCAAVPGAGNLALGKPVTASATEPGYARRRMPWTA